MRIKRFNESLKDKMTPKSREEVLAAFDKQGVSEVDVLGGISQEEYDEIIHYINYLKDQSQEDIGITDEEKVLSEIIHLMIKYPERGYDYDTNYHRRLGFIKGNKGKLD